MRNERKIVKVFPAISDDKKTPGLFTSSVASFNLLLVKAKDVRLELRWALNLVGACGAEKKSVDKAHE